jgi:hypothetical protein
MPYPILEPNRDVPDHYRPQAPQVIVELAREFIDAAEWTFASTMPQYPHHYVVKAREEAAGRHGYGFLRALIVEYHYLREWNGRSFRAVTLSGLTLWIMQTGLIVINAKPAEPDDWETTGTLFDFL